MALQLAPDAKSKLDGTKGHPIVSRESQIIENFREKLKEIVSKQRDSQFSIFGQPKDVHTKYLEGKRMEIDRLRSDIDQFENPGGHFTKQYRILEGFGTKLVTDLDAINAVGRDELRANRKNAYQDVDNLMNKLAQKAHHNGIACKNCEEKD